MRDGWASDRQLIKSIGPNAAGGFEAMPGDRGWPQPGLLPSPQAPVHGAEGSESRQALAAAELAGPSRRSGLTSRGRRALPSLGGSAHRLPAQATGAAAILPRQRGGVITARA